MTRLKGESNNRSFLILGTLVAVLLIGLTVWAVQRGQTTSSTGDVQTFDLTNQPMLGQADAPVTLVAFEDFKCPNCKNFEENIFPTIQQKYLDTGKAKMYKINFPFLADQLPTNDSVLAAQAAECAYDQTGSQGYEGMSTILFRAQGDESQVWATKDKLVELSGSVDGLDPAKMRECLDSDATKTRVEADKQQAIKAGVNGTPSVFVNGKLVQNFSADEIGKAIDAANTN
ncbi:disulfide bond formation protein DsbA [Deinococcus irradiatisoli]|uniref:Disulfide bond formation protein DsbA n=1 Tax=Deinococcus irradiatisoli TaxID=2202254 RepID=A0A2Z3JU94_9DEIO|nr:thioredoxin domain-containing protein [Deinococcus irradiatisoli]AWN24124.1 disulfide bond formation protein DsbA [Deinococcus irradiatisoli]